jgi:hypothetical protein
MLYYIVKLQCYNRFFTDKRTRTALCICGVQATAAITLLGVLATNALLVVQDAVQHHYHVHAGLVTSAFSESSRVLTGSSAALFIVCILATHKRKTYNYFQRCQRTMSQGSLLNKRSATWRGATRRRGARRRKVTPRAWYHGRYSGEPHGGEPHGGEVHGGHGEMPGGDVPGGDVRGVRAA